MLNKSDHQRPWWREPWPWIIMAGPLAAMIGCAVTIVLAVQNFADEPIVDGVLKRGLVVSKPSDRPQPVSSLTKPRYDPSRSKP